MLLITFEKHTVRRETPAIDKKQSYLILLQINIISKNFQLDKSKCRKIQI